MFTDRKAASRDTARLKLPWPSGKAFKILSIDGGGIRGIFPAVFLQKVEKELGFVRDHFDLIAGTSTGGIIAIGIGLGIPAKTISDLYCVDGRHVFPPRWYEQRTLRFLRRLIRPSHNHDALEVALKGAFEDRLLGESECRLVVPAFVGPEPQITVFKTDHHPDYRRDWQSPAWEVARATSAAPTFFAAHETEDAFFLDGGVWANNPIMCAVTEALSAFEIGIDQIRVLSIGNGNIAERLKEGALRAGMIGWRGIINTAMYLTTDSALSQARLMLGHDRVYRIEPPSTTKPIELDDWQSAHDILPAMARDAFDRAKGEIAAFFDDSVSPRERYYSLDVAS